MTDSLFHLCDCVSGIVSLSQKEGGGVMSLFSIHLFYTWLDMTPNMRPGSNEVQGSLTAKAHQGYLATETQTNDSLSHSQMDEKQHGQANSKSLDAKEKKKNLCLLLE